MSGMDDVNAMLAGTGGKAAAFPTVGTVVRGVVVDAEVRDQTEIGSGEVKTYPDGNPMKQIVITLQTEDQDESIEDDDGVRRVFAKGAMLFAIRKVTPDGLRIGGKLAIKYTGDGEPAQKGWNPPKEYRAQYEAPAIMVPGHDGPIANRDIDPW